MVTDSRRLDWVDTAKGPWVSLVPVLLKLGVTEPNLLGLITMIIAIGSPPILWWLVQRVGFDKFLFERPAWAHLPGTRSAREPRSSAATASTE